MHLAREIMLKQTLAKTPIAVLRPTLIYGAQDTHNSYGPNRLRRAAHKDGRITLFGAGEETREFIAVEDVVNLILLVVQHRSCGTLNLATGHPISYAALAKLVAAQFLPNIIEIVDTPRQNPITHRAFDVTAMRSSFPQFILTALEGGLATAHRQEFGAGEK
jgi:nucleoside-diphosphate-sugar epimerase